MISDWITSFSMWQTLIAASTATTVPSLPLPREGAAAVLLPPRRLGVLASIAMLCAVGVSGGRIGTTQRALQGFIFGETWRMAADSVLFDNRSVGMEPRSLIRCFCGQRG